MKKRLNIYHKKKKSVFIVTQDMVDNNLVSEKIKKTISFFEKCKVPMTYNCPKRAADEKAKQKPKVLFIRTTSNKT